MTSRILCGDARAVLATLPGKSVHCVVTSPPYLGLRSYSTVPVEWPAVTYSPMPGLPPIVEVPAMTCELGQESTPEAYIGHLVLVWREVWRVMDDSATCWLNCGDSYAANRTYQVRDTKGANGHTYSPGSKVPTWSGSNRMALRQDLTPKQIAYVLSELLKARASSDNTQEGRE